MGEEYPDKLVEHRQKIVDGMKTISLLQNPQSLTPPIQKSEDTGREIMIIEGLKVSPRLFKIYLEARGLELDSKGEPHQRNHAYLNVRGSLKFVQIISHLAEETEFSNFQEDEIPARLMHSYERDIVEFKINKELYELETSDFNWIDSVYQTFIDSSYHKAKGGKFINVVGKTYDERGMQNLLNPQNREKPASFTERLDKLNPFTKR